MAFDCLLQSEDTSKLICKLSYSIVIKAVRILYFAVIFKVSSGNRGEKDLGFMLYKVCFKDHGHPIKDDWEKNLYSDEADSVFYRPTMIDGVIDVEKYRGSEVC